MCSSISSAGASRPKKNVQNIHTQSTPPTGLSKGGLTHGDLVWGRFRLSKIIKKGFQLLNLHTFFTGGPSEVRAWTIPIGSTAKQSAGAIHSDFEKGFIKAEVFSYKDLVKHGSEKAVSELGLSRTEGKEYIVKDGDCMFFKFNV